MIKRSTWIWVLIFLMAIGTFIILKYRPENSAETTPTATASVTTYLFGESDGTLVRMRIYDKQYHIVEIKRPSGGLWSVNLPIPGPADQASAEEGATQVGALVIVSRINNPQPLSSMGLDFPSYVFKLEFQNGTVHRLDIGNKTPSASGYYARLDSGSVFIVGPNGVDALLELLKSPPYLPATSTPVPPVNATDTPAVISPTP